MGSLLIRDATVLVTMDGTRREIENGALYCEDGFITQVGPTAELPGSADEVFDATGHVVLPGLVNTHHHLYQTLTRAVPGAQNVGLFDWLRTLYPIWARMTSDHIRVSTKVGLAELALSGATTVFDHLYVFPNDSRLDDEIEAAGSVGVRLHASRGSMSLSVKDGGLPPDSVVQTEPEILEDSIRVVDAFHDPEPGSMLQVVLAPVLAVLGDARRHERRPWRSPGTKESRSIPTLRRRWTRRTSARRSTAAGRSSSWRTSAGWATTFGLPTGSTSATLRSTGWPWPGPG